METLFWTDALRSIHGEEAVEAFSFDDLTEEVAGAHRGMIAIPEEHWAAFHGLTAVALGKILLGLADWGRQSAHNEQVRGPERPPPRRASGAKVKHVSTEKRLENNKIRI